MQANNSSTGMISVGPFRISPGLKAFFGMAAGIGIIASIAAFMLNPDRAWPNFLINYFFFLALGLSGAFFTALQHITNAYWSVTVRRVAEGIMSYLPIALVLAVPLVLGSHHLYEWTHTHVVAEDPILSQKTGYLNMPFFTIRLFLFLSLWCLIGLKMRKNSLAQDASGEHKFTLSNIKLAAVFLPIFAISFTLFSFDLLMSLEPHWFSTIFGVYCFAGLFYSGLSLLAVIVIYGKQQGLFSQDIVNSNHLHDIGKLMFAFTVFWAYIMFSQLMLIWYANLPEEIPYYLRRFHDGWWGYAIALFLVHFIIPFFLLLPREAKRCEKFLKKMALFMLISQWMDVYMLVMPVFYKDGPVFGWVEISMFLAFLGVFAISIGRFLERAPAVPMRDPRLIQCIGHSQ